jgi:hypothetical protein
MSPWREDLSTCSLEVVLRLQAENWEWSKILRRKTTSFVNSRLAHEISHAEYQTNRRLIDEEAAEYRRRAALLNAQLLRHRGGSPARPILTIGKEPALETAEDVWQEGRAVQS